MRSLRILFLLSALLLIGGTASAQLEDGSYAADFTITDLSSNTHNLYTVLDSGYTVYLHFNDASVIWSHVYHWNGALQQLWNTHGPNGSDEVRIFFIEGDAVSTVADLQGTGPNTYGNYTNSAPYPMALAPAVAASYGVSSSYPRIFRVCPDRKVFNMPQFSYAGLLVDLGQCDPVPSTANDAAVFSRLDPPLISCNSSSYTSEVAIINYGTNPLTSVDVISSVNGVDVNTVNWTGSLTQFDTAHVALSNVPLSHGDLTIRTENPNGSADDDASNDALTTDVIEPLAVTSLQVQIDVFTDLWPGDISWVVEDANGSTVLSSPTYTQQNTWIPSPNFLPAAGCYKFKVMDAFGNGIPGGYITFRNGFGSTVASFEGGDWGSADSVWIQAYDESIQILQNSHPSACNTDNGSLAVSTQPLSGNYTY